MATSKSGNKSIRQARTKRVFNMRRLRDMRETVKTVEEKGGEEALSKAFKAIDKASKRGVIKKNTASRKKSQLAKKVARA